MADTLLNAKVLQRIDTLANWTSKNPILRKGEIGIISDTNEIRIGDGSTKFTNLKGTSIGGNAGSANKLETARTIALGNGVTSTATSFNGESNITIPVNSVYASYLGWGGKNIVGDISPLDAACIDDFGHNKAAFLPGDCITIERSSDGGSTWSTVTTSEISNATRSSLCTTSGSIPVVTGISASSGTLTNSNIANYKLRIKVSTRTSSGLQLYTALKTVLIEMTSSGATGNKVLIEKRTIGNYNNNADTWTTVGTYSISGWSGWNSIPLTCVFGGTARQTEQIADIRFTFSSTGVNTSYSSVVTISGLRFIGTTNWSVPSSLARHGHIYNYDNDQNVTFPRKVTAARLSGPLTGDVTGNVTGNASSASKINGVTALSSSSSVQDFMNFCIIASGGTVS